MEKYFEVLKTINEKNINIIKLYILSCVAGMNPDKEDWEKVEYCYDFWIDTDADFDLGKLADIVSMNWEQIKNDNFMQEDIELELFS